MSAPRQFPFGGVPVYNPQSLSKQEAIAQFHARQNLYQSLIDLLAEERPSHVLIIGTRGMGKTTLLQRVRYGVEDSAELNSRYLALSFPEEQYNVNRLHHFLLNIIDALADSMEQSGNQRMLTRVEAFAAKVSRLNRSEIEEEVPEFLTQVTQELKHNLLLLVDNADRLFETIEDKEQWSMRELLANRHDLTFFGATTQASEGIYGPQRAFFEFFKVVRLTPLTLDEVRTLLLRFSESVEEKDGEKGEAKRRVEHWLNADPGRLRTLVHLTGGNPRTTVLLFHLVLDGLAGGAREYLEQLLDQCTPNYKGRVDDLPPVGQQVLDALALKWDPATALEIAEATGLETNAVSTYLTRLVRQGLVEKVDPGDSKKALYQIAERFFNIWYLMRASRRVRAKLRWFIEFLRVFFDSTELERIAWEGLNHFSRARGAAPSEIGNILAYALASGQDLRQFEEYLRRECADREAEWMPVLEAIGTLANEPDVDRGLSEHNAAKCLAHDRFTQLRVAAARVLHAASRGKRMDGFWSVFIRISELIYQQDESNVLVPLYLAVALAQIGDFPRASVAFEDTLVGDPIELISSARPALDIFLAAAVKNGRVRECINVIEKKNWIDAWRPIYEALKCVEAGTADYLKRVAVEIREPARIILQRIAPELPGLPARNN